MYVLLHGAKKNVGDFLIFERARELIRVYRNTEEFVELPRWQTLTPHLDTINKSEALIWCGGPGYAHDFYPRVLPLVENLEDIKVPIVPMGLGWAVGERSGDLNQFAFTPKSQAALSEIHSRIPYSSTRDVLTTEVIKNAGFENVVTTGCAAWNYLPKIDQGFEPPKSIRRIVVTTPAQHRYFKEAAQVVDLISKLFPAAERYLVFHRGILPGKYTRIKPSIDNSLLALRGYKCGYKVVDASYDTAKIGFYEDCDLHIGYRVHAHIDFLSLRKPSILIQEDARGIGQSKTLMTEDILAGSNDVLTQLQTIIEKHQTENFDAFNKTIAIMQAKHIVMRDFVQSF